MVMYYADWCPHCHHYAPSFERIAQKVSPSHVGPVQFGALNCPDFMAFCTKIQIPGYPSVRTYHFKGDVGHALSGSRPDRDMVHDEKKFVAWLQRNAPEDNVTLSEPAEETTKEPKVGVRGAKQASTNSDSDSNRVLPRSGRSKVLQEAMPALHLADAEVAVLYSLRQGVFLQGESGTLQGPPLAELMSWLDYLGRVFPGGGHRPVAKLSDALHEAVASADDKLSVEAFEKLMDNRGLDRIPPEAGLKPNAFWRHCQGFTCGLWTLFHLLSQAAKSTSSESAGEELLLRVRGFVENFFGCGYCREHFLEAFDGCKLERCSLAKDDLDGAALWLWKMHNDVTLRVAKEDGREIPSPWPSAEDCEECWICQDCWKKGSRSDDDFKRAAILAYLRQEFSSPEWHEERHWLSGDFSANRAMPLAAVSALLLAAAALRCLRSGRGEDARGKDAKDS